MSNEILTLRNCLDNKETFLDQMEQNWCEIPSVNTVDLNQLQNGVLVRFRGMVQDMHSPEYYLEKYEIENLTTKEKSIRNGKYQDLIDVKDDEQFSFDNEGNINKERQTFVLISAPGLNQWVYDIEREKTILPTTPSSCSKNKRKMATDESEMDTSETVSTSSNKKICDSATRATSAQFENNTHLSPEFLLNSPLNDKSCKTCLVKMYENYGEIKINDLIEIVGFLAVDPMLNSPLTMENGESDMETQVMHPPPSLIPRIHCIQSRKLIHDNPLLPNNLIANEINQFVDACKDLKLVLTQLLLGDKLAAEYLICHLISRVYIRKDVLSVGQCSLNISNVPSEKYADYGRMVYNFLEMILPKSHYLPMTLENMNSLEFTPKKDYECNRLTTGLLQLSAHTHLIVDECQLKAGRLDQIGVLNVQALANVIKEQRLGYDFKYYKMHYESDIPVLVFSEGKSLLPSDFHIPIIPDPECVKTLNEIVEASKHFLNRDLLNQIRQFLTVARHSNCELNNNIEETIQEDFVKMRKLDANINSEDLHKLLVLSRLITLSQGMSEVGVEQWKLAQAMEKERRSRLKTTEN